MTKLVRYYRLSMMDGWQIKMDVCMDEEVGMMDWYGRLVWMGWIEDNMAW